MSLDAVRTIRARYPTPLGAVHGDFLEEVAIALSLGLVQKNWGTYVTTREGIGVSQDCLMAHGGYHWDILIDGENTARPCWELVLEEGTSEPLILPESRYIAPRKRQDAPGPLPTPVPPPPPAAEPSVDPRAFQALVEAVAQLAEDADERVGALEDRLEAFDLALDDLDERLRKPQTVKAFVGRRLYHDHDVTVTIEGK